jgi:hypothetical protein
MGSFARKAVGIAILTGTTLAATQPAAQARPAKAFIFVPCDAPALVSAVTQANALGIATLRLAPRSTYGITSVLNISGNVTVIGGPSTSIKQTTLGLRVINVTGTLRAFGIFIQGGSLAAGNGGGILNTSTLVLNFVTVSGNSTGGGGVGGGLGNGGRAFIANSIFTGNSAAGNGGAIDNDVPGSTGTLTLFASRLTGNTTAFLGGGISTEGGGRTRIIQSTISGNIASSPAFGGGGIGNNVGGTTFIDRTLVRLNKTAGTGGGILNEAPGNTVAIRLSIVNRNIPNNCTPVITGCLG